MLFLSLYHGVCHHISHEFWSGYLASVKLDYFINLKPFSKCAQRPKEMVGHQLTHTHTNASVRQLFGELTQLNLKEVIDFSRDNEKTKLFMMLRLVSRLVCFTGSFLIDRCVDHVVHSCAGNPAT